MHGTLAKSGTSALSICLKYFSIYRLYICYMFFIDNNMYIYTQLQLHKPIHWINAMYFLHSDLQKDGTI